VLVLLLVYAVNNRLRCTHSTERTPLVAVR
jgi:hypothetical protein